ncbi:three-Cys-motif partner protein TcmP [Actinomadura kijaniata]|uniref:three-Cys-motif partner protein TcmP n=1 Tax=Actinomadura kijaniata TaxID=46161 RepID=UPI003F198FA0
MPTPTGVTWSCDPHTLAKHELLRRYLEAWYPIQMQRPEVPGVTYIEGFAGPGIYNHGEPGSPVIAAKVFLRRRKFLDQGKKLTMAFIEEKAGRLERLKQEMAKAVADFEPLPATFRTHYQRGECGSIVTSVLQRPRRDRGPVLAFLDSFGGPDVPFQLPRTIAQIPSSEVLITFGTNFLTRFGDTDAHQASGDEAFGSTEWRQVHALASRDKKPFLVTTYRNALQKAGFRYVVSFEMFDETGADLHLVFGTSSRTGLEKMKDAMWKIDPVRGVHFRDPRDPGQMTLDFVPDPELGPLRHFLHTALGRGSRTVSQLKELALLETVYRPPHVTKALRHMLDHQLIAKHPTHGQLANTTRVELVRAKTKQG